MADAESNDHAKPAKPAKPAERAELTPTQRRVRWLIGWVLVPGSLLLALFLVGVHVGARHPDMALSRLMLWLFG